VIVGVLTAATLLFGSGCAKSDWIDRTLVTETVTGVWTGSMVSPDGQPMISSAVRLELQQQGAKVIGSFEGNTTGSYVGRGSTPIEGSVAGDMFRFNDARGTVNGELTVSGDEMTGHGIHGTRRVAITLRRVEAALPPTSPLR
jgi:hypothetical protein